MYTIVPRSRSVDAHLALSIDILVSGEKRASDDYYFMHLWTTAEHYIASVIPLYIFC